MGKGGEGGFAMNLFDTLHSAQGRPLSEASIDLLLSCHGAEMRVTDYSSGLAVS